MYGIKCAPLHSMTGEVESGYRSTRMPGMRGTGPTRGFPISVNAASICKNASSFRRSAQYHTISINGTLRRSLDTIFLVMSRDSASNIACMKASFLRGPISATGLVWDAAASLSIAFSTKMWLSTMSFFMALKNSTLFDVFVSVLNNPHRE